METYRAYLQSIKDRHNTLDERIQGTISARVITEFVGTSALFPILDAIRSITTEGLLAYLTDASHYVLFFAALVQAWFLGSTKSKTWMTIFAGSLLAFGLYAIVDILLEGLSFFYKPYHILFGAYSLMIALLRALQVVTQGVNILQTAVTLLLNIGKLMLFPAMYIIIDQEFDSVYKLDSTVWTGFMQADAHVFILYGVIFFGVLLGFAESQRIYYSEYLKYLTNKFKQYSDWSLGKELVNDAIDNPNSLELHRVERTILFVDIREFTTWSEMADPNDVVKMLNRYYSVSEAIITKLRGHKPSFSADEVMSYFISADDAVQAALECQIALEGILSEYQLSIGIGLHTGEVIEGMIGSDETRQYDIIGDAVNTAKRLESTAGKGEILISEASYCGLTTKPVSAVPRVLKVRGKTRDLRVLQ